VSDDVFASASQKTTYDQLSSMIVNWKKGSSPRVHTLLFGPPGSGRTFLLRKLNSEHDGAVFIHRPYVAGQDTWRTVVSQILREQISHYQPLDDVYGRVKKAYPNGLLLFVGNVTTYTSSLQDPRWIRGLINDLDAYNLRAFCVFAADAQDEQKFREKAGHVDVLDRVHKVFRLAAPDETESLAFARRFTDVHQIRIPELKLRQAVTSAGGDLQLLQTTLEREHLNLG